MIAYSEVEVISDVSFAVDSQIDKKDIILDLILGGRSGTEPKKAEVA